MRTRVPRPHMPAGWRPGGRRRSLPRRSLWPRSPPGARPSFPAVRRRGPRPRPDQQDVALRRGAQPGPHERMHGLLARSRPPRRPADGQGRRPAGHGAAHLQARPDPRRVARRGLRGLLRPRCPEGRAGPRLHRRVPLGLRLRGLAALAVLRRPVRRRHDLLQLDVRAQRARGHHRRPILGRGGRPCLPHPRHRHRRAAQEAHRGRSQQQGGRAAAASAQLLGARLGQSWRRLHVGRRLPRSICGPVASRAS
jgi:hypothetical protein